MSRDRRYPDSIVFRITSVVGRAAILLFLVLLAGCWIIPPPGAGWRSPTVTPQCVGAAAAEELETDCPRIRLVRQWRSDDKTRTVCQLNSCGSLKVWELSGGVWKNVTWRLR